MGFALAANAQSDQCSITNGNGGYLTASVTSTSGMGYDGDAKITVTVTPSEKQPKDGKVICKITYIRKSDGEREVITRDLNFKANQSSAQTVYLDSPAKRIVSIEIWGAECKSVNRNNYWITNRIDYIGRYTLMRAALLFCQFHRASMRGGLFVWKMSPHICGEHWLAENRPCIYAGDTISLKTDRASIRGAFTRLFRHPASMRGAFTERKVGSATMRSLLSAL